MWSTFLRTRVRDSVVAIFHELHPDPVFCSSKEWEQVQRDEAASVSWLADALRERRLIVTSDKEDEQERRRVEADLERKFSRPTILYLMTAQGCNLTCDYCPVPNIARTHGATKLSLDDAIAGIDLWKAHVRDANEPEHEYFVIFYGGEPLLNKEVIPPALEYLSKERDSGALPAKVRFMIATNGILVDNDVVSLCKRYDVSVAVGLDGTRSLHDLHKPDIDGNGTYDRVKEAIRLLIKNGIRTFVSATITPESLEDLCESSNLMKELGVEKFGFNFLKGSLTRTLVGNGKLTEYYREAARGVVAHARHVGTGYEYQMEKKRVAFETRDFFPPDCTCYGNQLVIQPDGQISHCPFTKANLGHVRDVPLTFRISEQPLVKSWRTRLRFDRPGDAKALEGGGCAWSMSELANNPLAEDESATLFAEEALDELIWSRYRN